MVCRLTAYLGGVVSPQPLVYGGTHSLYEQAYASEELLTGSVNADGFGVVWYTEEGPLRVARETPIWADRDLEWMLGGVRSHAALAALRNGTPGIVGGLPAVPPLVRGRWSFILNGYLPEFRSRYMRDVHSRIADRWFATLEGSSDTEALFLWALSLAEEDDDAGAVLGHLVREVRTLVDIDHEAQLNMVLTDGESLAATRASVGQRCNSLYVGSGLELAPSGVLIASERLDDSSGWQVVPEQSLVLVQGRQDPSVSIEELN